eukprot:CAMPEP_0184430420 /NCGR_PEP_ID=MMETSP0738-20130409/274234_1 /TAXON_ID=385413 /ORGANISM="Thalassiosira miniscula, Strain CCMP1093" /LENGTH=95 /DNA_ID=CAMNT_0026794995 /DNA_START=52 /DNA_END=337 /DNA_ORIENTATION=-
MAMENITTARTAFNTVIEVALKLSATLSIAATSINPDLFAEFDPAGDRAAIGRLVDIVRHARQIEVLHTTSGAIKACGFLNFQFLGGFGAVAQTG